MSVELPGDALPDALYPGIGYPVYASWNAWRSSVLRSARKSPAHLRLAQIGVEDDSTRSTALGVGVHCAVLEPALFERRYTRGLRRGKRGKVDELAHAAFELECAASGREVLEDGQWERCMRMRDALLRQPWRAALLDGPGIVELSVLWHDMETDVRCKSRIDRLTLNYQAPGWSSPAPAIVELKSAEDATEEGFRRSLSRFRYGMQARMQLEAMAAHDSSWLDPGTLSPRPEQMVWLVLESKPPFEPRLFSPTSDLLDHSGLELRHALAVVAECTRSGSWPGWPADPQPIDLAPWEYRRRDDLQPPRRERGERLRHEERHTLDRRPADELF